MKRIDLNADLGEGFGPWTRGDDAGLMEAVSSANIACGFHAGDPDVMARTMRLALEKGVGLGAHPGFADLQGFGRRRLPLSAEELANAVAYQLGAAQGMARAAGGALRHVKLHGALSNMAAEDLSLARACYAAALKVQPDIVIVAQAATAMEQAAQELGAAWAGEIFADRAYEDDATLAPRGTPGAVLHDAETIRARILQMLEDGAVIARSGKRIPCRIDTICVHGDTPGAVAVAKDLRAGLEGAGWTVAGL